MKRARTNDPIGDSLREDGDRLITEHAKAHAISTNKVFAKEMKRIETTVWPVLIKEMGGKVTSPFEVVRMSSKLHWFVQMIPTIAKPCLYYFDNESKTIKLMRCEIDDFYLLGLFFGLWHCSDVLTAPAAATYSQRRATERQAWLASACPAPLKLYVLCNDLTDQVLRIEGICDEVVGPRDHPDVEEKLNQLYTDLGTAFKGLGMAKDGYDAFSALF